MQNKEQVVILGATGSIGQSTLEVIANNQDRYEVLGVSGFSNVSKLVQICQQFCPKWVVVGQDYADELAKQLKDNHLPCQLLVGNKGLDTLASLSEADTVVAAIVGAAGLGSVLTAVQAGKKILLANKEALVMAGELVMATARQTGAVILPIDSEHNAIFQCLPSQVQQDPTKITDPSFGIKKLWLTASGGAFLHKSYEKMQTASVAEAVNHPNWSMGQKISVDSATMMNKGLEVIEAHHLFGVAVDNIGVVIHPQSIVHSLVEYVDGSLLAQCGNPDMKTPIAHALAYPNRINSGSVPLDLMTMSELQFFSPDMQKFACLSLAIQAIKQGNGASIVLNAANEVAVQAFLSGNIALTDIAKIVRICLDSYNPDTADFEKINVNQADWQTDLTCAVLNKAIKNKAIKNDAKTCQKTNKKPDKVSPTAVKLGVTFDCLEKIMALDKKARTIASGYIKDGQSKDWQ